MSFRPGEAGGDPVSPIWWHSFIIHLGESNRTTMAQEKNNTATGKKEEEKVGEFLKPDPETLHTTDPQEHMKGPISSAVQKTKETVEENNKEKPEPDNGWSGKEDEK